MANANNNAVAQAAVEAAYGTWQSPIAAEMVAKGALRLGQPSFLNGAIYWLEGRPAEGGRSALVKAELKRSSQKPGQEPEREPDQKPDREPGDNSAVTAAAHDVTPAPTSVRSLVHEYGGGAYLATAIGAFYANFEDQRIYFLAGDKGAAVAVTDVFDPANSRRYADFCYDSGRKKLYCVMEKHSPGAKEPANLIVAIDINPGTISEPTVIAQGCDFYSAPRLSPDGKHLAYLCWNHPNMPWDGCELRLVTLDALDRKGAISSAFSERHVAGGTSCSIFQPQWSPDNRLFFVTDESGYWQPRVISDLQSLKVEKIFADAKYDKCEFGQPLWSFGQATYSLLSEKTAVFAVNDRGLWSLIRVDFDLDLDFGSGKHKISEIKSEFTEFSYLSGSGDELVMLAASAVQPQSVVHVDLSELQFSIIKSAASDVPSSSYLSVPEVIEFPTESGLTAFAFFYPPTNSDCKAAADSKPPLVVKCHGGPTGAASSSLSLGIQYWTSRGYAVVDVNYGGSTGYGRAYRERLNGNWGVVDVADCRNCVEYLVKSGRVDGERVAITGGSAGGYTVLCALTFTDTFKAGASHYGIGDLEALARDTHKFESRYEDNLVAPYPAGRDLYIERSPIHHVEQLNCPVIFFQGLDDKIVPPNQAEAMVDALKTKGIAVAFIAYEGESHGFRKSENIIKTIESEYYFFCRIFGINACGIGKIAIENLD